MVEQVLPGPKMIFIPGGSLRFREGGILRRVEGFWMDETPVTVAQYREAINAGACTPPKSVVGMFKNVLNFKYIEEGRESHPVNFVNYCQASAYAKWAGKRLPTVEEWVWAAQGGPEGRMYPWGGSEAPPSDQLCWNGEGNDLGWGSRGSTSPVGSYPKGNSKHGIKDLVGNVREWTSSISISRDVNIVCGCGFTEKNPIYCENYNFTWCAYYSGYADLGFRCIKVVLNDFRSKATRAEDDLYPGRNVSHG